MTIKELEQELEIPRATIRYYEKEGLINPQRSDNSYREYSKEDVATLKKIIVFRKIGMSVSDIKEFFNEQSSLQELLEKNISDLQEKMKELEGAIKVCKTMQEKKEDISSFDEDFYWNEIRTEEKSGKKFLDIVGDVVKDVVQCEKSVLKKMGFVTRRGKMKYSKKGMFGVILAVCLWMGFLQCVLDGWSIGAFVDGFTEPFVLFIIFSLLEIPQYIAGKRSKEAAQKVALIEFWGVIVLLAVIFGVTILSGILG